MQVFYKTISVYTYCICIHLLVKKEELSLNYAHKLIINYGSN